jgi:hypothetical protein
MKRKKNYLISGFTIGYCYLFSGLLGFDSLILPRWSPLWEKQLEVRVVHSVYEIWSSLLVRFRKWSRTKPRNSGNELANLVLGKEKKATAKKMLQLR